jgi:chromosome segregation protein
VLGETIMRLQRLEISGFKSFSDRSELAFDRGVTAIVGPNGCGKSNVADAITWVLGEQSAKSLRGDRMEDVIFSGSDARKPTGTAEVRLMLSDVLYVPGKSNGNGHNGNGRGHGNGNGNGNGHGDLEHAGSPGGDAQAVPGQGGADPLEGESVGRAVEVTRRLYRSGESEYLIDGRVCRLRDVHDLLADTGLGAKAYSIIEQGKIGMILSSRPTDRRQLIEEAAGITKYKARRRAAELKLEAAQQNLTRIDDIVFEVEKQRGTLKRQAAKARRYRRLRGELRSWEKVLFARKYRELRAALDSTRARLFGAREDESAAAARVSTIETELGRLRIELVEAESRATAAREAAHGRELEINRRQQQIAFNTQQVDALGVRMQDLTAELDALRARREPGRLELDTRRGATERAERERDAARGALAEAEAAYVAANQTIEGLEGDVEAARSEVFSAINAATALRHAIDHADAGRQRVSETLAKLDAEASDVRIERERVAADRAAAADALRRAQEALDGVRIARAARESELASARIELEWRTQSVRARERALAALTARLTSLEELDAARAGYTDAARMVLAQANGKVGQMGAVADHLEVERGYERVVESVLGDLLQHVLVERHEHALAGLQILREHDAGRCGFLVTGAGGAAAGIDPATGDNDPAGAGVQSGPAFPPIATAVGLSDVVRVNGPHADVIRRAIGHGWITASLDAAIDAARSVTWPVATREGDVVRGAHLVNGGGKDGARGILATKAEIKDLRERIDAEHRALSAVLEETATFETTIAHATAALSALNAEQHKLEKAIVGLEMQIARAGEDHERLDRKAVVIATERGQAEEEMRALDARQEEARTALSRLEGDQRGADEQLAQAQRRLFEAREATAGLAARASEAKAAHAALVERASALAADVQRLEAAAAELEVRVADAEAEIAQASANREELRAASVEHVRALDLDVVVLEDLRQQVRTLDEQVSGLRAAADAGELAVRGARQELERCRAIVGELDVARATAEADLSHLSFTCEDAVHATLDEVLAEVEQRERDGGALPPAVDLTADESEDAEEAGEADAQQLHAAHQAAASASMTAEEAIAALKAKIDRLGPVNMMAIEQFDELEARHGFLTTQRKDLVDSIAQTAEAIKRIDETTKQRFRDAFEAINHNFQETFSTLFGGGRAGLTLLDESDVLESGIEIIAQPPGKRLQSVQLLSGGEKALTAIALMFGIFKYKPSPFCLLDEIDAPLDDANIGRFVEMLRSMLARTQFILITHNRKTMEIADRLYGVTMEEPGVSKLISVQLN